MRDVDAGTVCGSLVGVSTSSVARPPHARAFRLTAISARRGPQTVAAAVVYSLAALIMFGAPLLHTGTPQCVCLGNDESILVWAFEWWPHALVHGLNPFVSHIVYAPQGFDLALATTIPGPALLLAPVTAIAGPLFSYNLAMVASPALAAFFAFLLCRRVSGRFWSALLGGWLFGFSTYMAGQMLGHVFLTLVFLVPAIVHLILRAVAGELSRRIFVGLLAVALILQLSFSSEVFATLTLFLGIGFAIAFALADAPLRTALRPVIARTVLAYVITGVITSPYLYYALKPGGLPVLPWRDEHFSSALLSFVVPGMTTKLGGLRFLSTSRVFSAGFVEGGAYLGVPLIVLLCLAVWHGWRRRPIRIAAVCGLVIAVLSLGGHLQLKTLTGVPLPWWPFERLPILGDMLPSRFVMYLWVVVAVLVAWWLASLSSRRGLLLGWGLAIMATGFVWPAVDRGYWKATPNLPPLFTDARYSHVIGPRDVALLLPVGAAGDSMLWQGMAHLRFPMASGYLVAPEAPDPYKHDPVYPTLTVGQTVPLQEAAAGSFIATHGVTVAVVDPAQPATLPWLSILAKLGWHRQTVGGVIVLRPARAAPRG
jgi:hypothetical protein